MKRKDTDWLMPRKINSPFTAEDFSVLTDAFNHPINNRKWSSDRIKTGRKLRDRLWKIMWDWDDNEAR